jgi:XTP/dITP diphosphohydrolase
VHKLYSLKKAKKILIATNNPGKFKELKEILPKKIKYFKPRDFNLKEPIENGKTFKANAKIKSLFAAKKTGIICISDDSGLEVDSLNKIYNLLKKKNKLNSKARFVCAISIAFPDGKSFEYQGKIEGNISFPAKGKKGFGYDPIFVANGDSKTFAEISKKKKNKTSHRFKAFSKVKKFFKFS